MTFTGDLTTQLSANGSTASCNGFFSPYDAYRAFDHSIATGDGGASGWFSAMSEFPHWISYYFGTSYRFGAVCIRRHPDYQTAGPTAFKLQGSNNGVNYTDLYTETSASYTNNEVTYNVNTSTAYSYFRLYVTANGGAAYVGVHEITITEMIGWSHTISGVSTPAYVCGVAGSAISKVMGV